ncbi:MAG TPA: hypothetical protein VF283_11900 [Bryobacteraceae bacterium]
MPVPADAGYAFWEHADGSFRIEYSLAVFHEIDFSVGEGFRSIPHGGVETGGLLFGRWSDHCVRVEAFRPIECEHASGPSFALSERDLEAIGEQLRASKTDPELSEWEPLGWFVAHTRSDLAVSEQELAWFGRFFPEVGRIAVLVKPERFQPTRFAFLIRKPDGQLERDGRDRAVILPLPGRASGSANGPVPSLPPSRATAAPVPTRAPEAVKPEHRALEPIPEPPARREEPVAQRPVPSVAGPTLAEARGSVALSEPSRREEPRPRPAAHPVEPPPTPPLKAEMFAYDRSAARRRRERLEEMHERRFPASLRLFVVLLVAAVLGCAAGYWAYLQLPSATIRLSVRQSGSQLIVSWPPQQTSGAAYAAIRINDGVPAPLSRAEKATGQATVQASGDDVKVELTVQHWMRQSRGIVRFVTAAVPAS